MKYIMVLILFFLIQENVYAETKIIEGKSESNVSVSSNVQGNGNVRTRIEVNVNGNKKVVESDKPGKIEVKVTNDEITVKKEEVEILGSEKNATVSAEKVKEKIEKTIKKREEAKNIIIKFVNKLLERLRKLFS